ncbi:hypothetical protein [Vibrio crassostreae]|uniref:hypothetical protein n=1 Tax=Vibrio crassostreae TaxID=246167 RepID=UPI001B303DF7|nr:hypothetical protein [Vibrio crassostreae]
MNHNQIKTKPFYFTDEHGKKWSLNSSDVLPPEFFVSDHYVSTVVEVDDYPSIDKVFPIHPVEAFNPESLPKADEFRSRLTIQSLFVLMDVYSVDTIVVINESTGVLIRPNYADWTTTERITLEVNGDLKQYVPKLKETIKRADTCELVKLRAHQDECRFAAENGVLNDWLDHFSNEENEMCYFIFTRYQIADGVLALYTDNKSRI